MSDTLELVKVRLVGLPIPLLLEAQQHGEELRREFSHVAAAESDSVPARLTALSQHLRGQFGSFTEPVQVQIDEAAARGEETIDVTFEVPRAVADAAVQMWAMLEEVDEYCRAGDLLTLAPTEQNIRLRGWYLSQFIDQIKGADPVPFDEYEPTPR